MRKLLRIPLVLIMVISWAIMRYSGINLDTGGGPGMTLLVVCIVVLIIEFFKSGDISLGGFGLDLLFVMVTLIIATATTTIIVYGYGWQQLGFVDMMVLLVTLCDSWVPPYNSFRTALRNLQVGGTGTEQ